MILQKRTVANTVLILSSLALTACGSFGGPRSEFNNRIYGGVGGLVSQLEPNADDVNEISVDETQSAGGSVIIGFDVMPRVSIEGHYSALGEATFNPQGSIDYQVAGLSALVYGLNDRRARERREGFSLYGRIGGGLMENEAVGVPFERVNDYHLLAGVGAEYGLSNGLGVRLEAVSHDLDALYAQAALIYRIGGNSNRVTRPTSPREPAKPEATIPAETAATTSLIVTDAAPLDSDGDGVLDTDDQCSDTTAETPVGSDGCTYFDGVIEGVVFSSGSDVLTLEARGVLGQVVDVLAAYPQARISIGAHTDNQGPSELNLSLSKRRAIAVTRFLVEQGVDGSRLAPRAYGESNPVQSNDTAAGRAANRRVEFNLL